MRAGKLSNDYAKSVPYDAPKAVWKAIAISLARRLNDDDQTRAVDECYREWNALHENGIVPQKPRWVDP
jgi:hypothetical protein